MREPVAPALNQQLPLTKLTVDDRRKFLPKYGFGYPLGEPQPQQSTDLLDDYILDSTPGPTLPQNSLLPPTEKLPHP